MKSAIWWKGIAGVLALLLSACSGNEYKLLTKDTATSRSNTLVIMGIKWVETYNDTKLKVDKTVFSYELLNDTESFKNKRVKEGKPELYKPLHYMHTFMFELTDDQGKDYHFVRFAKDMRQYENIALYEFKPGQYSLNEITMIQNRFEERGSQIGTDRWKRFQKNVKEEFGSWELPAGKVVYLGDLTLHFRTKRFIFGFFTPEELVQSIKLEKVEIRNNFEEMKIALQEQKPWFPIGEILNLAVDNEWVYTKPEEAAADEVEPEAEPEKKSDNAFY